MAQMVQRGQVTPADELRDLLEAAEKRVANVRWSGDGTVTLLKEMDRIAELWPELEAQGVDLRPEAGRWGTIQTSVERRASALLGELQKSGGIAALRKKIHPDGTDASWWHLDEYVVRVRRKRIRRIATIGIASVIVAVAAYVLIFKVLFPVDPKVAESAQRVNRGEQLVQQSNDWAGAAAEFRAAAALTPDQYDVWLRLGVAEEKLGNTQAAQDAFGRARAFLSSDEEYLVGRGSTYLLFGLTDPAGKDLQAALAMKKDDAQAWYQMASVYEARGQMQQAIDALDKASTYAEQAHQDELNALARYRMGMMMQRLSLSPPTDMAAPTP
jgi:tetratricopeptide (TPR) repeat protein